jgi:hypothetical protein
MTLSIELDSPCLDSLTKEASALGVPLEELASRILHAHTHPIQGGIPASDSAFREAMAATFEKNEELYRRLAK